MTDAGESRLLRELPPEVAKTLRDYLAKPTPFTRDLSTRLKAAFERLGWPPFGSPIPLASMLTREQRAAADLLARRDDVQWNQAMPTFAWSKRRWLGLDPPGALEEEISVDGKRHPLWFVLAYSGSTARKLLARLPLTTRIGAECEMMRGAYQFTPPPPIPAWNPEELDRKARAWAAAYADRLVADYGENPIPREVRRPIYIAIAKSGAPWRPAWNRLVCWPSGFGSECARVIPEEHRSAALLAGLADHSAEELLEALEAFPSEGLARKLEALLPHMPAPMAKKARARLKLQVTAAGPALTAGRRRRIARVQSATMKRQLERAAQLYDGKKVPLAERLTAKTMPPRIKFEYVGLSSGKKTLYDAYLMNGDSGVVFRTGTTDEIAQIIQTGLQCDDDGLRESIELALARARR